MKVNKPRSSTHFKPGDMFIFSENGLSIETGILVRRFDMYEKAGKISDYPSWCWEIAFSPNNRQPWLYNDQYGASEVNLYNCIGKDLVYLPRKD